MSKYDLKARPKFAWKSIVNMQRANMKYETIKKSMALERVEVNLLKFARCY